MSAQLIVPAGFEARPYQTKAINDLREELVSLHSVILYAPTGAGKTAIACDITARAAAKGRQVMFIGDSTEIVEQTSLTMHAWNVGHGIIQSGNKNRRAWEKVHVATIQTLRNRTLPHKDLVFVDECHLARAASWETTIRHYIESGAKIIGLSATPCRLDGRGLGSLFQKIIYCPSIEELTAAGYLVPFRVFAPPAPDVSKARTHQGDYRKDDVSVIMDKAKLVGDCVAHYGRAARDRLAILAATSIQHSMHLRDAFRAAGIAAEHADGTTRPEERKRVLSMPSPGVICQVDICGKGWDRKEVSCAIDCRPTMSQARWLQFIGRTIRISLGKVDSLLLDHAGNVHRFGMPDDPREWTLDDAPAKRTVDSEPALSVATCRKCFAAFRSGRPTCPACGAAVETKARKVTVEAGQLEEVRREKKMAAVEEWRTRVSDDAKRLHYGELVRLGTERGYKPNWAAVRYHAIYDAWPPKSWRDDGAASGSEPGWNAAVQELAGEWA